MVGFMITSLIIVVLLGFTSYYGFKSIISRIWEKLVILDKIFEERYNELSKTIFQFQKYMPEQKDLIFEIQRSKADAAKVSKPKTAQLRVTTAPRATADKLRPIPLKRLRKKQTLSLKR